ncbi:MAG: AAC(3) family N-acetyltransferase [Actinomycetota bacterium]
MGTSEVDLIEGAEGPPVTAADLSDDLDALGVATGGVLMVHTSLSRLGWVVGGAQAVVEALLHTVGPDGTIVMPSHSTQLSEPADWGRPPVPAPWVPIIRDAQPAYHPQLTPTRMMGAVVECFRHVPGARRSGHPQLSVTAHGPKADLITAEHPLADGLGEDSPLGRLYDLDARILLLGVDHRNNTSLHLAEYRAPFPGKRWVSNSAPVVVDGERQRLTYTELDADDADFARIGEAFASTGAEAQGRVGRGLGRLCTARAVVDFATNWMSRNRR